MRFRWSGASGMQPPALLTQIWWLALKGVRWRAFDLAEISKG